MNGATGSQCTTLTSQSASTVAWSMLKERERGEEEKKRGKKKYINILHQKPLGLGVEAQESSLLQVCILYFPSFFLLPLLFSSLPFSSLFIFFLSFFLSYVYH